MTKDDLRITRWTVRPFADLYYEHRLRVARVEDAWFRYRVAA